MAARGLGKGLDSLIPNALGETKTKKETTVKSKKHNWTNKRGQSIMKKIKKSVQEERAWQK